MKGKTIRFSALAILLLMLLGTTNFATVLKIDIGKVFADPGWLSGWNYRLKLTVNSDLVDEDLTDFPTLVKLDSSFFDFNLAKNNGEDIRFTSSDGTTQLKYEIERWSKTAGKAEIWVKLPSISSTVDTDFYIYYSNTGASDAQEPANVWDSNYKMVQHLEETSGTVTDSTSNDNDGSYHGATQDVQGKMNGADEFDGVDDYIAISHSDSLNLGTGDFTISVWVKYPSTEPNNDADILRKGNTLDSPPNNYKIELASNRIAGNLYDGGDSRVETTATYGDDNWHFVVFRRAAGTIYLYVDGELKDSETGASRDVSNTATMSIGSKNPPNLEDFFDGVIDEVRISKIAKSEAWMKADYITMNNQLLTYPSPPSGEPWADPECKYRVKLTFQNSGSSTNLTNFPVLVVLNNTVDTLLYSRTSATDIRFYDGSTLLYKETELWNSGGNSYIWVKVPQINAISNTDYIYAYYNSSGASNPDSATNVWPTDQFAMVLHLKEAFGTSRVDSTSNNNAGTANGGKLTHITNGQINGADDFAGTGTGTNDAYISIGNAASLNFGTNSFSYSFWFKSRATGTQDVLDKKGGTATGTTAGYKMVISSVTATGLSAAIGDGTNYVRLDTGMEWTRGRDVWAMFTVVVARGTTQTMISYVNGTQRTQTGISSVGSVTNSNPLYLGKDVSGITNRWYQGGLDEVRISNVARSADWIKADYLSTKNSFVTFGSVEEGSRSIDSCDSGGVSKDSFNPSETVFVKGSGGYASTTNYPIYIVSDTTWTNGMSIPGRILGTATTVTSDSSGNIPTTSVWSPTLTPGKYDIVVDVNSNGVYNQGIDALDDLDISGAGFFVIPEYAVGTILALVVCFAGVGVYRRSKRTKLKP